MKHKKGNLEIIFGFHSVFEALKAGKRHFHHLLIAQSRRPGERLRKIEKLAEEKEISIQSIQMEKLDKLTRFSNHQGIAAKTGPFPVRNANEVIPLVREKENDCFILVLESIEDPHNLGALIRSAHCNGVDYILIPKDRSASPSPAVSRSSAGAMEHTDIFMITNTSSILKELKKSGIWVSGLDGEATQALFDADLTGNIALIVGGEHKGIRPGVKKQCDFLLSIPNKGKINSLNASVAGGIAMYEAMRQRN